MSNIYLQTNEPGIYNLRHISPEYLPYFEPLCDGLERYKFAGTTLKIEDKAPFEAKIFEKRMRAINAAIDFTLKKGDFSGNFDGISADFLAKFGFWIEKNRGFSFWGLNEVEKQVDFLIENGIKTGYFGSFYKRYKDCFEAKTGVKYTSKHGFVEPKTPSIADLIMIGYQELLLNGVVSTDISPVLHLKYRSYVSNLTNGGAVLRFQGGKIFMELKKTSLKERVFDAVATFKKDGYAEFEFSGNRNHIRVLVTNYFGGESIRVYFENGRACFSSDKKRSKLAKIHAGVANAEKGIWSPLGIDADDIRYVQNQLYAFGYSYKYKAVRGKDGGIELAINKLGFFKRLIQDNATMISGNDSVVIDMPEALFAEFCGFVARKTKLFAFVSDGKMHLKASK